MDWNSFVYFPVLKTKDAELRAISAIDASFRKDMLPIYEITKSRITKKDSLGDILKRLAQIKNIQGDLPYILDVTTDPKQKNSQIEGLLSPVNGYECWQHWLNLNCNDQIVPMIHINFELDEDLSEAKAFVSAVASKYKRMALRLPTDLESKEYQEIVNAIVSKFIDTRLYILLDEGCIRDRVKQFGLSPITARYQHAFDTIATLPASSSWLERIICISGSFPYLVSAEGKDDEGNFPIYEHSLYLSLKHNRPELQFGDYASVNVKQVEMRGGTFVPRVDFCSNAKFYYYRKRRDVGSYVWCAGEVLSDPNYFSNGSWADGEIANAAAGTPSGINPSFWISVRACNYMIYRVKELRV